MPIEFKRNKAIFHDIVAVDEAETLLEWLQKNPNARVDLSECSHLHAANLQVLLAAHARIHALPQAGPLSTLLGSVFHTK